MNSTEKGDKLEDEFYKYLVDQQSREEEVFGIYPHGKCKILRKKKYPSRDRGAPVEFDVVIELYHPGRQKPHFFAVFECKNYAGAVPEDRVREFSDKLKEIFPNRHKGVMVVSSKLQSGARNVAESRGLGIAKYDERGAEIVVDRKGRSFLDTHSVKSQIFRGEGIAKPLKFSAYCEGNYFGTVAEFLASLEPGYEATQSVSGSPRVSVPYIAAEDIKKATEEILKQIEYEAGPVDLAKICLMLGIDLRFTNSVIRGADGAQILGSANFDLNTIEINSHQDSNQQRFTIGHEIGHFCLRHQNYLRSETILERDLEISSEASNPLNYDRLEFQANAFSADLILPDRAFIFAMARFRLQLGIKYRGLGFIFVDDQQDNLLVYYKFLTLLSIEFEASKQMIEIKLRKMGLLNDQRVKRQASAGAWLAGTSPHF
ncbi:protein of unknown function DUF955 [Rhizobium sp. CF080]|uniref:ImmA/IrrE family metallo-endopeptidase n=1 Tax=Rhizobium sp. (strain CF080) TaxID=1144310 RepID=UPI000271B4C3|nr:ImmA/IrrE family metallo-endopeptidase [Rhizobium sp. CF080]EUB97334.1 protein of unknown function DUF955 [Rhizobium sp. CF080]